MRKVEFGAVKLEHFRCHESMEFNFIPNRFVTITGPNGIGKTTILDALCWALYDVTTKGRKGDSVIRKRSGKNTYVRLDFKIDDDYYIIKNYRKHHKLGDSKLIYKNGEDEKHDISGATRKDTNLIIEQLLMPKDIFLNCLCCSCS